MNARQLRALLADVPDETPIIVDGYESGFDAPSDAGSVVVAPSGREGYWNGKFTLADLDDEDRFAAFYIGTGRHR
ncbi:hypothetical protein [Nocardia niwae]|uniref:hypothetical protein n=1 Tax=Nocardia niwae TaxID=626084 RepID=UPI0007A3E63F|nr:hypothetical protein [Nocardia niwae]